MVTVTNVNVGGILYTTTVETLTKVTSNLQHTDLNNKVSPIIVREGSQN